MNPKESTLIVEAGVRYWEDATVNGVEDTNGTLIPCRKGDLWCPVIELATGKVRDWPANTRADVHYKVCDAGQYWLGNLAGSKRLRYKNEYVPSSFLAQKGGGYGDYIIMTIDGSGMIEGWKTPEINEDKWDVLI